MEAAGDLDARVMDPAVRRINVTGNAGAGKTTLSRRLGLHLGLPVVSLDSVVWGPNWEKVPLATRQDAEKQIVAQPRWVIDGVSRHVRDAADLVVFLDVPRRTCYRRCVLRNWWYLFRSRPELPENCPEWRIILQLCGIIWRFPAGPRHEILREARADPVKYRLVPSAHEIERLCEELAARRGAASGGRSVTAPASGRSRGSPP
jgi:adenylate kinase family enzyme